MKENKYAVMFDFETGEIHISDGKDTFCYNSDEGYLLAKSIHRLITKAVKKWKSPVKNSISETNEEIH